MALAIATARLHLRPFTLADLDPLAAIWADPAVMTYVTGSPRSRQVSAARLQRICEHQAQHGFSLWAATRKADQRLLGYCGLQYLDHTPEVEVGYGFAQCYWGQGLATEAARASVHYGFTTLGLDRIVAVAKPANRASRRVIEKIGLCYEQIARYYNTDCAYYAINRDQWKAASRGSAC